MKKRIIPLLAAVYLFAALLPTGVYAVEPSARTIAQAYKQVISAASFSPYTSTGLSFCDLNGDGIPELFLLVETDNPTLLDYQIWTYRNGDAEKIGSDQFGLAGGGTGSISYYLNANGNFAAFKSSFYYDEGEIWGGFTANTYGFDSKGNLTIIEAIKCEWDYNGDFTGSVNGQPVSEWEGTQLQETKKTELQNAPVKLFDDSAAREKTMSKSDAISFLEGVDAFFDVPWNQYYAEPVRWAVEKGITNGTGDYSFSPDDTCTRAQILTFLWRSADSPSTSIVNPFSDISPSNYYYQAALWAYQNGMVAGSRFEPSEPCTRAATVTYIWQSKGSPAADFSTFSDVGADAAYSKAVSWAVNNGITNGTGSNRFSPGEICSRGQIVTFLYRACSIEYSSSGTGEAKEYTVNGSTFHIEPQYVAMLREIQTAIASGNKNGSGLSEAAASFFYDRMRGGTPFEETKFALNDINGDGTKELMMTTGDSALDAVYAIIDGQVRQLISFSYRNFGIAYGNVIASYDGFYMGFSHEFFKFDGVNLYSAESIQGELISEEPVPTYKYDSSTRGSISETEYASICGEFASGPQPTWYSLMDFSF